MTKLRQKVLNDTNVYVNTGDPCANKENYVARMEKSTRNNRGEIHASAGSEDHLQKRYYADSLEEHNTLTSEYGLFNENRYPSSTYLKTHYGYS